MLLASLCGPYRKDRTFYSLVVGEQRYNCSKLAWNLTRGPSKRTAVYKGHLFSFHVSFPECNRVSRASVVRGVIMALGRFFG